ncbi:MAG: hypothetical protein WC975_14760 [Phycisphaerae bacterium]
MSDEPDYILELGGYRQPRESAEQSDREGRAYISVLFECCNVYSRVYKNTQRTAYVGWCPKCARKIQVRIAADGVNCRFFRAK